MNMLKKMRKVLEQRKKSKPGPKKKTKAEFFEGKRKTLADSDKGSCVVIPVFLPSLFLVVLHLILIPCNIPRVTCIFSVYTIT